MISSGAARPTRGHGVAVTREARKQTTSAQIHTGSTAKNTPLQLSTSASSGPLNYLEVSMMRVANVPRARVVAPSRSALACRAKLEMKDVRAMKNEDIDAKVVELKSDLLKLRIKQAAREKFVQAEMPAKRKDIARLLTVKRERELEQGISKRESRNIERRKLVAEGMAL